MNKEQQHQWQHDVQICAHHAEDPSRYHGAVVPPVYENSLFVFETFEDFTATITGSTRAYLYGRGTNPTVEIAERKIAALENGEECKLFASGMAAISSALMTFLKSGDHVLYVSNIYGPTIRFLDYIKKFGIEYSSLTSTRLEDIEQAIRPSTKVIYLESPTTMTMKLVDLRAVADLAKQHSITTMIDNTWATPLYQKPINLGIDVVLHSVSKYMGGHSDLIGGAMIASKEVMDRVYLDEFALFGGIMAPREASLLTRGLRSLPLRMKAHTESAMQIAQFLETHPAVDKVNFPGLPSSPDYELGKKQLSGYSGLLSFELKSTNFTDICTVINALKHFQIGVSWGSFESLVLSPNYGNNTEFLKEHDLPLNLIRISIGLEPVELLTADLDQALNLVK